MPSYSAFSDEQLADKLSNGCDEAFFELVCRFDATLHSLANVANVDESEKEDLYQEGLIGLYRAALTYDLSRGASFRTYAYLCIKHSIYSSLRVYFSKKNNPVRTGSVLDESLALQCPDSCTEPEKLLIERENLRSVKKLVDNSLSEYEKKVFKLFLKGHTYDSVAKLLSTSPKSVDNAIQRIRGKLKRFIE